jgi:DNA-binding NarL/FixJ family response regulator
MSDRRSRPLGSRAKRRAVLLERAEELTGCGSWLWNSDTGEIIWSDNLYRLFGVEPGTEPTLELVLRRTHPQDRPSFERHLDAAAATGSLSLFDFRVVRPDGSVRHLRTLGRVDLTEEGEPGLLIGAVQDLTDQRLADREIAAHVAVSEALTDPAGLGAAGEQLLCRLGAALDFTVGALWVPEGPELVRHGVWSSLPAPADHGLPAGASVAIGRGLAGCAAAERRPIAGEALPERLWSTDTRAARRAGLRGGLAIPALTQDEVLAVVELRSAEPEYVPERLARSLVGVAHQLGAFLTRRRGELSPPLLTARELEVLQLTATGLSGPAIAAQLVISPATVKTHLEHIYAKLGVPDRAAAVARGLRDGIIK